MLNSYFEFQQTPEFQIIFTVLLVWEMVWKGRGLWFAARNGQKKWFVVLLIINSIGILPIVYLKFFQKKK